jgi:phosphate transport system substrate-binding protein
MAKMTKGGKITLLVLGIGIAIGGFKIYRDKHPELAKVESSQETQNPQEAVVPASKVPDSKIIMTISGSSVINDDLTPKLIKAYMGANNYSDIQVLNTGKKEKAVIGKLNGQSFRVNVQSSGTKDGIQALEEGKIDICMASAPEAKLSESENVIGLDGIAVITNQNNPIDAGLSKEGLLTIFSGQAEWGGVSGATSKGKIKIYRMGEKTGIYKMFKELVMNGTDITGTSFERSQEMVDAISNDPNGIGFVSYTFLSKSAGIKAIPISDAQNLPCIFPNARTIASEKYPLCRRLCMYSETGKSEVLRFTKFVSSDQGQEIVKNAGFVNLTIETDDDQVVVSNDPPAYKSLINQRAEKLTTEFRFKTGSDNLDSRGLDDVERLDAYLNQSKYSNRSIVLVGFTDNTGSKDVNMSLSKKRAEKVKDALEARGLVISNVIGMGPLRPSRDNSTDVNKSFNRRVEVWVK